MKWHCGNASYTSRDSKIQSTKTFVWKIYHLVSEEMSQWKRGQILNSKREMIGSMELEEKDLQSEHKLLMKDMKDNRQSVK